jgi:hypothetical protein
MVRYESRPLINEVFDYLDYTERHWVVFESLKDDKNSSRREKRIK